MVTKSETRTKSGLLVLMLALAAVLSAPNLVFADNGEGGPWQKDGEWHHGQEPHFPSIEKVLNLSDDQAKQLKDIHQKQWDAMKAFFDQIKANREALNSQLINATPDMGKVNDIEAQFKSLQSQMVDDHLNSLLAIKKVLTPEQFIGFMALKKEHEMIGHHGLKDKFGNGDGHKHGNDKDDKPDQAQIVEDQE